MDYISPKQIDSFHFHLDAYDSEMGSWLPPKKITLPLIQDSIFFDIETDTRERIWLIGAKLNGKYYQFLAHSWSEEKRILQEFLNFLKKNPGKPLISYSKTYFDFRLIWYAIRRLRLMKMKNQFQNRPWIDLAILLNRYYSPPKGSLKLKDLAYELGYNFQHKELDGLHVALNYITQVEEHGSITKEQIKNLLEYNIDDIDSMIHIIQQLQNNINFDKTLVRQFDKKKDFKVLKANDIYFSISPRRDYVSVSMENDSFSTVFPILYSFGIPEPKFHYGKKRTNMTWSNKFAKDRFKEFNYSTK